MMSYATFLKDVYIIYPEPVNLLFYIAKTKLRLQMKLTIHLTLE